MENSNEIQKLKNKIEQLEESLQKSHTSELLLRKRESALELIIDQSFQFMLVLDSNGFILEVNRHCFEVFGRFAENAIGSLLWEVEWWRSFPEVKKKTIIVIKKVLNGETVRDEVVFLDKNGVAHQSSCIFTPLRGDGGDIEMISVVGVDTSGFRSLETKLDKQTDKIRQAQKIAKLGYWYWNVENNSVEWSDEMFTIFGRDPNVYKPTVDSLGAAIHPDDYQFFVDARQTVLTQNRNVTLEHRIITPIGQIRTLRNIVTAYKNTQGVVSSVMGAVQDVTERVDLLRKYKKIVHDQSTILDNIPGLIFFKDTENNIIKTTESVAQITGLPREEIEGRHSLEIYPDMAEKYWIDDLEVIRSGKPKLGILESLPTKDGKRWILTDKIPYYDAVISG